MAKSARSGRYNYDDIPGLAEEINPLIDHGLLAGLGDGSDHSFIDQSVISGATPTLTGTNFTGIPSAGVTNNVSATAVITDHTLVRGDGGAKVVQDSGITIDDSDNMSGIGTISSGAITSARIISVTLSGGTQHILESAFATSPGGAVNTLDLRREVTGGDAQTNDGSCLRFRLTDDSRNSNIARICAPLESTSAARDGHLVFETSNNNALTDALIIDSNQDVRVLQDLEIDGALNHDGSLAGFYNTGPITQPLTTGEAGGFTAGTGTGVNDDSTFTGGTGSTAYRISDIVRHLKRLGLIAS